jgi:hypothetical protein
MSADDLMARFDRLVLAPVKRGVVEFRCPVCNNLARTDGDGLEPACTGPHPSLDEHPLTPMVKAGLTRGRA